MHAFLLSIALFATPTGAKQPQQYQPAAKHIDIDDDEVVEGGNADPGGTALMALKQKRFGTLIKLRENFTPEMLKSAE